MTSIVQLWKQNLETQHKGELIVLKAEYPKKSSLTININNTAPELFDSIVTDPMLAENALYSAIMEGKYIPTWNGSKHTINIRFIGFPHRIKVSDLNSKNLEKFTSLRVVVKKVTTVKPRLVYAAFKCNACKDKIVYIPVEEDEVGKPTDKCLCGGQSWRFMLKSSIKKDYQTIQVQDPAEDGAGTKSQTLTVKLLDDLTGKVQPGNIIVINGIYRGQQKKQSATLETYLDAKSVEITNKDFTKIEISKEEIHEFEELARNPEIYGMLWSSVGSVVKGWEAVKQAILLQLLGGVEKINDDGDRFRPDFHILLCGDPSVAKSKILRSAYNLCPRGVYASGKATSAAGLTAAANKGADGSWELEAGAAVLADKGVLIIDELDKVDKEAVSSLHEILEEQCFDDKTEILTESGWKLFKDLLPEDKVAQLGQQNDLEFVKPTNYTRYNYNGEMVVIKSRQVDCKITPGHNLYVDQNTGGKQWTGYHLQSADSFKENARLAFKKNAEWIGEYTKEHVIPGITKFWNQNCSGYKTEPIVVKMETWLEFLGWFLSEGSIGYGVDKTPYRIVICQMKQESRLKIKKCIESLGFKYTETPEQFIINSKQLATHLQNQGKQQTRFIPEYAMKCTKEQLQHLFKSMMDRDGTWKRESGLCKKYITTSKQLADDMQILALKVGFAANVYKYNTKGTKKEFKGKPSKARHNSYVVSIMSEHTMEPTINQKKRRHMSRENYIGEVFCVEVPSHIIYIRRNGFPCWSGNCLHVNKAGISADLATRESCLAACNPKRSRFDKSLDLASQVSFAPSLLSRFGLIFLMTDEPNAKKDREIAKHIINSHRGKTPEKPITVDTLRKYIAHAKQSCEPEITDEAAQMYEDYYAKIRAMTQTAIPITPRQIEDIIRMSEASAKTRLSPIVEAIDVTRAIWVYEEAMRITATNPATGEIDVDKMSGDMSTNARDGISKVKEVRTKIFETNQKWPSRMELVTACVNEGMTRDSASYLVGQVWKELGLNAY